MEAPDVCAALGVDPAVGLRHAEAARRLAVSGPNVLPGGGCRAPWRVLVDQLRSVMVAILAIAAIVSVALGDVTDAAAILAIVALNTVLGFLQEYRAERALEALNRMAIPSARVRREGRAARLLASRVAPGDVVLLEAGDIVPADGRLLEAAALRVAEASLTGESEPVSKDTRVLDDRRAPLGDRASCVYMGTTVVGGRGVAVITETGAATEIGRIAGMLQGVKREPTPLQRRLDRLGRQLAVAALALVGVLVALGVARGEDLRTLLLTALGMAVAAVPEGLPAVVTVALALGTQRMLRRQAQIRKLPAVETLGSVTVICSDKTGTLTQNRMTVGSVELAAIPVAEEDRSAAARILLAAAALCSDAARQDGGALAGDPTEVALVAAAEGGGLDKERLEAQYPRVAGIPFDPERKLMTTIHQADEGALSVALGTTSGLLVITKGAVDALLPRCQAIQTHRPAQPLGPDDRERLMSANARLAATGMRVIGVAVRGVPAIKDPTSAAAALIDHPGDLENSLAFIGMIALHDPPRAAAADAVAACRTAGIRPVMITGDHPLTAVSVARAIGIGTDPPRLLVGADLAEMGVDELTRVVDDVDVYARVAPAHKLKVVEALQRRGHVVAMTGDGVNDAPALKKADIGVAMGASGTDVAKEAAEMVLLDDDFATIVAAVEEGRTIRDNVRKFVRYLMASNAGELWLMLLAPLAGMPLPLLPLQILWVNLVTDGPAALALAAEPAEADVMRRPPYPPGESILARGVARQVVWVGLLIALLAGGLGYAYWLAGDPRWQTVVFTIVVLAQMANVLAVRSERESLFRLGFSSNVPLLAAVALTVALQLIVTYWRPAQLLLGTDALPLGHLLVAVAASSVIFWMIELEKWLGRRRGAARP